MVRTTTDCERLTTGGEDNDVRENGDARHVWNSITLQVQRETVERVGHKYTPDP